MPGQSYAFVQQGYGPNENVFAQVDGVHQAARQSIRPLDHGANNLGIGVVGGHFSMSASYSSTAAKPAAGSDTFSMRWADPKTLFVLLRFQMWVVTTTTYTASINQDAALYKASGFTVAASGGTQITPTAGSGNRMRMNNMAPSLLGVAPNALWVSSGDLLTTGTRTLDTQPLAYLSWRNAITTPDAPTYGILTEHRNLLGHPVVLALNEGLVVQTPIGNAQAAGVSKYTFIMDWAEVASF